MKLIIVSNGHGEDVVGVGLGQAFARLGYEVACLPLVGKGNAYERAGFPVLGPRQELPSGGFIMDRHSEFLGDLRAGWCAMTWKQWRALRQGAQGCCATISVGDLYCLATVHCFGRRPIFQMQLRVSLLAWTGKGSRPDEIYTAPERALMRRTVQVFTREPEGVEWLRRHGVHNVQCLGNPMLDVIIGGALLTVSAPYLMLLPGSRRDAYESLPIMLECCRRLRDTGLAPVVAWAGVALEPLPLGLWSRSPTGAVEGVTQVLKHPDGTVVWLAEGSFQTIIAGARVAICTAGTATEQVVGSGVPAVSFPTNGPQFLPNFAQSQQRMLREAVTLTKPDAGAVVAGVRGLLADAQRYQAAQRAARVAMGQPGASARIASQVHAHLEARARKSGPSEGSASVIDRPHCSNGRPTWLCRTGKELAGGFMD